MLFFLGMRVSSPVPTPTISCHAVTLHLHPRHDLVGPHMVSVRGRYTAGNDLRHGVDDARDVLRTSRGDRHGDGDQYHAVDRDPIDGLLRVPRIDTVGIGQFGGIRIVVRALVLHLCSTVGDDRLLLAAPVESSDASRTPRQSGAASLHVYRGVLCALRVSHDRLCTDRRRSAAEGILVVEVRVFGGYTSGRILIIATALDAPQGSCQQ